MRPLTRLAPLFVLAGALSLAHAQDGHQHQQPPSTNAPAAHLADQTFDALMTQAMDRMHAAMSTVPRSGRPDHDFLAAMVPHHQGAIDMAKAVLLVTPDPRVRNLAQSIITEQQYEIDLMTRMLADTANQRPSTQENAP